MVQTVPSLRYVILVTEVALTSESQQPSFPASLIRDACFSLPSAVCLAATSIHAMGGLSFVQVIHSSLPQPASAGHGLPDWPSGILVTPQQAVLPAFSKVALTKGAVKHILRTAGCAGMTPVHAQPHQYL